MENNLTELKQDNKVLIEELHETNGKLDDANEKLDDTKDMLSTVSTKLNVSVIDRVPKVRVKSKLESFVLLYRGKKISSKCNRVKIPTHMYYAIRGQKFYANRQILNFKDEFPDCKVLVHFDYQPNPRNLFTRVKEKLNKYIQWSGNWFSLKNDFTEKQLLKKVKRINDEKLEVQV